MYCILKKKRYFEMRGPDEEPLHIEAPKVRHINDIASLDENAKPADMAEILAEIISRNREKKTLSAADLMDWMDMDQMADFLAAFLGWVNQEKEGDPN